MVHSKSGGGDGDHPAVMSVNCVEHQSHQIQGTYIPSSTRNRTLLSAKVLSHPPANSIVLVPMVSMHRESRSTGSRMRRMAYR